MSTGIDIVLINRFANINDAFLNKYFTNLEREYINNHINTLAGIFAAKEAIIKAIGMGIGNISLKNIEINHDELGKPFVRLYNELNQYNSTDFAISISHDGEYAIAIAIYKKTESF